MAASISASALTTATMHIYSPRGEGVSADVQTEYPFFTGSEDPANNLYKGIMAAFDENRFYKFSCPGSAQLIDMKNIICVVLERDTETGFSSISRAPSKSTGISATFRFTQFETIMTFPNEEGDARGSGSKKTGGLADAILSRCRSTVGTVTLSNGVNKTVIASRRHFVSLVVKAPA